MRKLITRLFWICVALVFLAAVAITAMLAMAADAQMPEPDMSAYPPSGCTSAGTFPGERTVVRFPVPEGFLVCHVWAYAMNKTWQFSANGCQVVDGFGRKLCVTGIGTREVWIVTDGSFAFTNFAVFDWSPEWLPVVWSYP